jgi:hypothetical protein
MKRTTVLLVATTIALTGCGVTRPATDVLVIGNSITFVAPTPDVQWSGDWGMAASSQRSDFSHLVANTLGLPLSASNLATLERTPANAKTILAPFAAKVHPGTIAVVELGDNVPAGTLGAFKPGYDALLDTVQHARNLVCTSTFWAKPDYDAAIEASCTAHGGTYLYIGDIRTDPANPDYVGAPAFANPAVDGHPHDWSMGQIALRVLRAVR